MKTPEDGILVKAPVQRHALEKEPHQVEDVESLMDYIERENKHGDLEGGEDELPPIDPIAIANEIQDGGSW